MTSVVEWWGKPPRPVPTTVKVRLVLGSIWAILFGWSWLGISLMLTWSSLFQSTLFHPSALTGSRVQHTKGVLTGIESARYSENEEDVFGYQYQYTIAGASYSGISYDFIQAYRVGDTVQVIYLPDEPGESKIEKMRTQPVPALVALFVLLSSVMGVGIIGYQASNGVKQIRLLETGVAAIGKLVSEKESEDSDGYMQYALIYQFTTLEKKVYRSTSIGSKRHKAKECLLYDPQKPSRNVLLYNFNCQIEISLGQIEPVELTEVLACLLLPLLVIIGHTLYLVFRFPAS